MTWQEWEGEDNAELWCRGWSMDRTSLAMDLYRLGYASRMGGEGGAFDMAERATLRETWVCTEDSSGDERTLAECDGSAGDPQPVTFVILPHA
jgi:hypothetical protein